MRGLGSQLHNGNMNPGCKFIAHGFAEESKKIIPHLQLKPNELTLMPIGAEGDFSSAKIEAAIAKNLYRLPVSIQVAHRNGG